MQIREESRLRAVGSIILLATAGVLIFAVGWFANSLASPAIKDVMQSMFNTGDPGGLPQPTSPCLFHLIHLFSLPKDADVVHFLPLSGMILNVKPFSHRLKT